jgi:serine phosphatase RsbU (regulator of sigma subunit)
VSWAQSVDSIKNGAGDLLLCLAESEERKQFLNFSQTYAAYPFVIVTTIDADFVGSLEDLNGKTVAVPRGYIVTEKLKKEFPRITIIQTKDLESALMYVSIGKADATVGNLGVIGYYLNYGGYQTLKIAADTEFTKLELKMAVSTREPILLSILDKTLSTISQTEKMEILEKWGVVHYDHGVDMAKIWRIALICLGIVFLVIILIVIWNRTLRKEINKRKVAEAKLQTSFSQIQQQKEIIEIKNQEVTDSIKYAKRIQNAILPSTDSFENAFESSFVLYKPKDIVAGDFYWLQKKGDLVLFAAADCTGHGVPGAMVSVVCSNALNKVVNEMEIYDPGVLLNATRDIVIERFEGSESDIKDGMDISLAVYNKANGKLQWAGAYNPLWVVKSASNEFVEIKADKQPIGKCDRMEPFTTHTVELDKGDKIYLFTDGFADQFGGSKGKKIRSKTMKELVLKYTGLSMTEQMNTLDAFFEDWMGDLEQLDDICIIGVEV